MIDTVKIKFNNQLSQQQLSCFSIDVDKVEGKGIFYRYHKNVGLVSANGSGTAVLKCEYYPKDFSSMPLLCLEFSVPKIIYGNNYQVVMDINHAIHLINPLINKVHFLPPLDIGEGIIVRIDFCYNHQVDDDLHYYLRALSKLSYPHRENAKYLYNGVKYLSKNDKTTFYDKFLECNQIEAKGFLRHETCLWHSLAIERRLHQGNNKLKEITLTMADKVLNQDLERLKINECQIETPEKVLDVLSQKFKKPKALSLFGFCKYVTDHSEKEFKMGGYLKKETLNQYKRDLWKVGLTPVLSNLERTLPPLKIDWKNCL